jgi:hypothetical protein
VIPDLRWSAMNQSAAVWEDVVIKGSRKGNGMVSFAPVISSADAEAIRAYVIKRANDTFPVSAAGQ